MSALPAPRPIAEYRDMTPERFEGEIRPAARPAILRGIADAWPAVHAGRAGDEALAAYFLSFSPRRAVKVVLGAPEIEGRFFYTPDYKGLNFTRGDVDLAQFFDRLITRERHAERPFSIALQSEIIPDVLPGFAEQNSLSIVAPQVAPRMWIGNRVQVAPHYDLMENVGVVASGRRRFTLFPPDQMVNLYTSPLEMTPAGTPISLVELANPDLERFPRYAEAAAVAQSAVLDPGDAIYIPFHWWHGVDSLDPLSAFINYWWNPAPAGLPAPYPALFMAIGAIRNLPDDQRAVWRQMFDYYVFGDPSLAAGHLPDAVKGMLGPPTDETQGRLHAMLRKMLQS